MPIIIVDPSFAIHVVNDAYVQMSGIDKEQLLRMSLKEFRVLEQTGAGLKQVIQDKKRSYGEVVVQFPKVPAGSSSMAFPFPAMTAVWRAFSLSTTM